MYRNSVLALAALIAGCSTGNTAPPNDTLFWTLATQREGGAPLPLSEIKETLINWGPRGGPYTAGSVSVPAPATTVDIPRGPAPGTVCYIAFTVDTNNLTSDPTNEVCVTVNTKPKAPSGLGAR